MELPPPDLIALFAATLLVAFVTGLTLSAMFPAEHRPKAFASGLGPVLLFATLALTAALVLNSVLFAARTLPWAFAVIGGGLTWLVSPFLYNLIPARARESRLGLLALGLCVAGAHLALWNQWRQML